MKRRLDRMEQSGETGLLVGGFFGAVVGGIAGFMWGGPIGIIGGVIGGSLVLATLGNLVGIVAGTMLRSRDDDPVDERRPEVEPG